ncbi:hypothetical protein DE146DRAFT_420800 [Phaeosphaeria sp. MPI-PUGE-AT-0046c]|nr:hypothetical protein DE146DRAFT_420800 [Phaeosphaeria sp. MPI-PUGE-AT-0046c]
MLAIRRRAHTAGCHKGPDYTNYSPFAIATKARRCIGDDIEDPGPVELPCRGNSIPVVFVAPVSHSSDDQPGPSVSQMQDATEEPDDQPRRCLHWATRLRNSHSTPPSPDETSIGSHVRAILRYNYAATFLLPFIPAGFVVNYHSSSATIIFCVNFVAIFPSATILSAALNDLNIRLGQRLGALLNQTFGNVVQLILSILLLKLDQITVLKLSIIGTILSNLLLATGLSFLLGGRTRRDQYFSVGLARMICQLLLLSLLTLTITFTLRNSIASTRFSPSLGEKTVLALSRGISVLVLILYALWLVYSSHPTLVKWFPGWSKNTPGQSETADRRVVETRRPIENTGRDFQARRTNGDGKGIETPLFSASGAVVVMIVSITLLAFNTQFTTDSIQGLLLRRHVSQTFLSLIILPLLSVDPMAISMATKDKMDMSILLTVERCMQTSLLLAPLTVIIGSGIGSRSMNLDFDPFSLTTLFLSVILVTHVMQGGRSNWLMGVLLIQTFVIIALAAFYMPGDLDYVF